MRSDISYSCGLHFPIPRRAALRYRPLRPPRTLSRMAAAVAPITTTTLRVFLVEDSDLVRDRMEADLATVPGLRTIGHAETAADAIRQVLAEHPDVVLLDLRLREGSGMDVLNALHAQAPEIDVYLCSNYAAEPYRSMALRLGAREVFDKSTEFGLVRETLARRAASHH